jgi:hypothetical protein
MWLGRSGTFFNACSGGIAIGDLTRRLKDSNVMSKTCMASCKEAFEVFSLKDGWSDSSADHHVWKGDFFYRLPCEPCVKWQRRSAKSSAAFSFLIAWQLKQG